MGIRQCSHIVRITMKDVPNSIMPGNVLNLSSAEIILGS